MLATVNNAHTTYEDIGLKIHLLLETGRLLMESRATTNRITRDLQRAAAYMGIPENKLHLYIMSTTIIINVSDANRTYTSMCKCRNLGVNMTIISAVSKLAWKAISQNFTLADYAAELERIKNLPPHYNAVISTLGAALACGGFCVIFGSDLYGFIYTALAAACGFTVRRFCNCMEINSYASIAIAAFVATLVAWLTSLISSSPVPLYPVIACSLFIVPGIPLINAVDDLLNNFIIGGTGRAMNALLIIGSMTFGIIVAINVGGVHDFTNLSMAVSQHFLMPGLAAAIAAAGFAVIFNVPPRLLLPTAIGGSICVLLRNYCELTWGLHPYIGSFIGAAVIALLVLRLPDYFRAPTHVIAMPAVIPLIPGVLLYRLLFAVINIKSLSTEAFMKAVQNGVEAVLIIIGIAVGVAIPNIFAHRYLDKKKKLHWEELKEQ
jgi:uncharacterized membrane protein YjjP (DUF1212 family)